MAVSGAATWPAVLGVRHHGPGSARAVRAELERLKPDVVLIEGPPEADEIVALAGDPQMEPPVALLAHVPQDPSRSAFWPFARFSPEWQAITWAVAAGVPVRFCDLPAAHALAAEGGDGREGNGRDPGADKAQERPVAEREAGGRGAGGRGAGGDETRERPAAEQGAGAGETREGPVAEQEVGGRSDDGRGSGERAGEGARADEIGLVGDPVAALAEAAGYDDPERWWEDVVEHRGDTPFQVIAEAMAAVREGYVPGPREARREAYMRRTIRRAMKDGFRRVAVVCGAWHVPALLDLGGATADERLLRGMPKAKVSITWVPWTYGRLAVWSGYGAGVRSPGWYDHLFAAPDRPVERWLAEAARVLRDEGLGVSSAHVIEGVRLAEGLAAVRGRPLAGLSEVTEAVRAVLCEGDELPVELVRRRMAVGERLGRVPDTTPMVPLQRHLREEQRRVRLKAEATPRDLDLDLRKPLDLERSRLLHRLALLGVPWGTPRKARGKGTFRESWTLEWRPEYDVELITAGAWGTTVPAAAVTRVMELAQGDQADGRRPSLAELTALAERCLPADLPQALPYVLDAISAGAALDGDVTHLMAALPALARAWRYGDVRGTPPAGLAVIVDSLLARVRAGLSPALTGLDDDSAREMTGHVDAVHAAVALLAGPGGGPGDVHREPWLTTLEGIAGRPDLHGLIDGRLTRILLDAGRLDGAEVVRRMSRATSAGHPPARVAAWVEGFLSDGGLLLVHDSALLHLIDDWLMGLGAQQFVDVLPLLRRTFGAFAAPERRAIGERVRARTGSGRAAPAAAPADDVDEERAAAAVRTVLEILARGETR